MNPVISVRGATKTYGEGDTAYQALRGVDLDVHEGDFVMLSGPSGSGKTTLLSMIGCVLTPTSGSVKLLGHELCGRSEASLPALRSKYIGFIFQSHNLIASLDARSNVALMLQFRGRSWKQAREEATALLDRVGLGNRCSSKPSDLSGGQRQRIAIARALAGEPPVILADEPTASLDAQNGLRVTEMLRILAKEHGHTVVVVTHDSRIFHLADRRVHIEDGRISEDPDESY